jgi:hypothetical protein
MRFIQTFLLRLYTAPELREQLCGDLRILPGRTSVPFKSQAELVHLLRRYGNKEAIDLSENEPIPGDDGGAHTVQKNAD